jgi:drug/metabolite transporter (DMT)-like permease
MTERIERSPTLLGSLLCLSAVATLLVHAVYVRRYLPGEFVQALPYLVVGWATFGLAFYALGRLLSRPGEMPNMRSLDGGIAVFLASIVISGIMDTAGITVERAPLAHALPAIGVYVGLALAGWGLGERAKVIERITTGG